jgi:hypothetical protein
MARHKFKQNQHPVTGNFNREEDKGLNEDSNNSRLIYDRVMQSSLQLDII